MARLTKERIVAERIMSENPFADKKYYVDVETTKVIAGVAFKFVSKKYSEARFKVRFRDDFKSTELFKIIKKGTTNIYCIILVEPVVDLGVKKLKTTVRYYDYNHTAEEPEYKDYEILLLPDMYHIFEVKGNSLSIDHKAVALDKSYPFTDESDVYFFTNVTAGYAYYDFITLTDDDTTDAEKKYVTKAMVEHKKNEAPYEHLYTETYHGVRLVHTKPDKSLITVDITTGTKDSAIPEVVSYKKFMFGDRKKDDDGNFVPYYRALMEKITT